MWVIRPPWRRRRRGWRTAPRVRERPPPMSAFLATLAPRWFTIPAHRPFLEDLAKGLWREPSLRDPEALAEAVVLLPTRRAARSLAEAFLKVADSRAVLLPQIRALGDLDEGE